MIRDILTRGVFYWLRAPRNYADFNHEQWVMGGARLFLSVWLYIALKQTEGSLAGLAGTSRMQGKAVFT